MVVNDSDVVSFYKYLISKGYCFNKEIIENYLLSLKVKPFIILSGNSGTGKTKLSQLFAKYLGEGIFNQLKNTKSSYISFNVKSNKSSWKNNGWTLSNNDFVDIFPINECQLDFKMNVDGISAEGNFFPSIQVYYDENEKIKDYFFELYEQDKNTNVELKIDCDSLNNLISDDYIEPESSIVLKQNANKSSYSDRQWLANYDIYDYVPFKKGYVSCNLEINGISVTGRIRITFKISYVKNDVLQKYLQQNVGKTVDVEIFLDKFGFDEFKSKYSCINFNSEKFIDLGNKYQIVPVGANWTDNTNIIGYYNAITEEYQSTPSYDLINKSKFSNNPYFLILDEMNLSHVERYFADFLSAIESKEPIPIFGKSNESLILPDNLFIIGTVNVDETTYMFSPKVLDRANTIEFDTLSVSEYINSNLDEDDFEGDINYLQSPLVDSDISNLNIVDLKEILSKISCDGENLLEVLTNELNSFQSKLKPAGFDFGFRVINEILRFMVVAWRYENSPDNWDNWQRYFDAQIKQKILPKLHGSQKAIGNVLNDLFNLCLVNSENNEQARLFELSENDCKYHTSALKLQNMAKVLSDQRYVSFIN